MPEKLDVAPTRGNLLQLRDQLEQYQQGHDLLDRKREVLTHKLFQMFDQAEEIEQEARKRFKAAHEAVNQARMKIGLDRLQWISLSPSADISVDVESQSIMGVMTAIVSIKIRTLPIPYGPGDTVVALDKAHQKWLNVAQILGDLVESTVTVWRLATELRKTQRQVNALEQILIPRYQATIEDISNTLEEKEREEIVHAKKVKHGLAED